MDLIRSMPASIQSHWPTAHCFLKTSYNAGQVEEELRAERAQAEAEELRAKQAIEQKQQELQQIESAREQEVRP